MRKITTNRQKWTKITMVTRHRVYGPTNLCSPLCISWFTRSRLLKINFSTRITRPRWRRRSPAPIPISPTRRNPIRHSLTKCPGCWQRKHKGGDPLSFETGLREKSLRSGLTSLPARRTFKIWRSVAINNRLSPKNVSLNFSNIMLLHSQSTVHVYNFIVYLIIHCRNFIIHVSEFFTKNDQFTSKSNKIATHQLELLCKFR